MERTTVGGTILAVKWRIKWLAEGEKNTKFVYNASDARRRINYIDNISFNGRVLSKPSQVKEEISNFYITNLRNVSWPRPKNSGLDIMQISAEEKEKLEGEFSHDEVLEALNSCNGNKAPGLDSLNLNFIKAHRAEIKEDFVNFMKDFYKVASVVKEINKTFIALIPKNGNLRTMKDFRPISLVGSMYKILAKVLANRIKKLQFADDTILFIEPRLEALMNTKRILRCFELASGLKINFCKSYIVRVGKRGPSETNWAASFHCKSSSLPITYLGLPLGTNLKSKTLWDPVVNKGDGLAKRKIHTIRWDTICNCKELGGLGIGRLLDKNKGLLAKWVWRFGMEVDALWRKALCAKYRINTNSLRWEWSTTTKPSQFIKAVGSLFDYSSKSKRVLREGLQLVLGYGDKADFWNDIRWDSIPLRLAFPRIFAISTVKEGQIDKFARSEPHLAKSMSSQGGNLCLVTFQRQDFGEGLAYEARLILSLGWSLPDLQGRGRNSGPLICSMQVVMEIVVQLAWNTLIYATTWMIWEERNQLVVNNRDFDIDWVIDLVKFRVVWWFKHCGKGCHDSITLLLNNIKDLCIDKPKRKAGCREEWTPPPFDTLFFNVNGSARGKPGRLKLEEF
ncbi:hypothetical protein Dsin_028869 [Dipteronia sinensis]|uniref:Reverse transcriptase domain-containing protein n=1 Tax=Dipteronia sinensis TaxID=43782 RepID=A0AAE0DUN4_9ROSI|nr:hypothetical protein Dsin_028869 [Dipteronia sinensis]